MRVLGNTSDKHGKWQQEHCAQAVEHAKRFDLIERRLEDGSKLHEQIERRLEFGCNRYEGFKPAQAQSVEFYSLTLTGLQHRIEQVEVILDESSANGKSQLKLAFADLSDFQLTVNAWQERVEEQLDNFEIRLVDLTLIQTDATHNELQENSAEGTRPSSKWCSI